MDVVYGIYLIIQATFEGGPLRDEQGKVLESEAQKAMLRGLWSAFGFLLVVVVVVVTIVGVIIGSEVPWSICG